MSDSVDDPRRAAEEMAERILADARSLVRTQRAVIEQASRDRVEEMRTRIESGTVGRG